MDAALIVQNPKVEAIDNREDYGEVRWVAFGLSGGTVLQVVYTWRMVTDENANVVARHVYAPFGQEIPQGVGIRTAAPWGASEILDDVLPRAYSTDAYKQKCSAIFEHFYESYPGRDVNVYSGLA